MPAATLAVLLEVMDKEVGVPSLWLGALVLGGLGFLLARRRWWAALPVLALLAVGALGPWSEWRDPFVGPAIAREAGRGYPWHLALSTLLGAGLTIAGALRGRRAAA